MNPSMSDVVVHITLRLLTSCTTLYCLAFSVRLFQISSGPECVSASPTSKRSVLKLRRQELLDLPESVNGHSDVHHL